MKVRTVQLLGVALLAAVVSGCTDLEPIKVTRLNLTTFDAAGTPQHHYTDFHRASFRRLDDGRLELVLKSDQPSTVDPTQSIAQIMHVNMFWQPVYGRSRAEPTQINAHVQYAIITAPTGVRYDGGAFVTYRMDRQTGEAVGRIESGTLSPKLRMGNAAEPFGPARFTATFRATENPGEVVNTQDMLKTQFNQPINR